MAAKPEKRTTESKLASAEYLLKVVGKSDRKSDDGESRVRDACI